MSEGPVVITINSCSECKHCDSLPECVADKYDVGTICMHSGTTDTVGHMCEEREVTASESPPAWCPIRHGHAY